MPNQYTTWRIIGGRAGCFLDPPGSAQYKYEVIEGIPGNPSSIMSLEYAVGESYVPENIREQAAKLLRNAPIAAVEDEEWVKDVYRHFKYCYSPDGASLDGRQCLIVRPVDDALFGYTTGALNHGHMNERPPLSHHMAVMHIRKWYPLHEPREDLI